MDWRVGRQERWSKPFIPSAHFLHCFAVCSHDNALTHASSTAMLCCSAGLRAQVNALAACPGCSAQPTAFAASWSGLATEADQVVSRCATCTVCQEAQHLLMLVDWAHDTCACWQCTRVNRQVEPDCLVSQATEHGMVLRAQRRGAGGNAAARRPQRGLLARPAEEVQPVNIHVMLL